jgi:hypothetical protein
MTVLFLAALTLSLARLAWVDIHRYEIDPAAAAIAAGALLALRLSTGSQILLPIAFAATIAATIALTALLRPTRIGLGDAAIIPLIPLAAPLRDLAGLMGFYGILTLAIALLYLRLRRKPLRRLRNSVTPAAPAAAATALTGGALLTGASPAQAALLTSAVALCLAVCLIVERQRLRSAP